jgi:hypothetical protein
MQPQKQDEEKEERDSKDYIAPTLGIIVIEKIDFTVLLTCHAARRLCHRDAY